MLGHTRKDSMHHPSTGVAMAPGKQEVEKKGKISEVYLDSPISPKNVVDVRIVCTPYSHQYLCFYF